MKTEKRFASEAKAWAFAKQQFQNRTLGIWEVRITRDYFGTVSYIVTCCDRENVSA